MKNFIYLFILTFAFVACNKKENSKANATSSKPTVSDNGKTIVFPNKKETTGFFETESIQLENLSAEFKAPAKVVSTIIKSTESNKNLVLFDDPELTDSYTSFIQHQLAIAQIQNVKIKQKKIELQRYKDLAAHGAATEKDVLEAQTALAEEETNLLNEKASLTEQETVLKLAGFNVQQLMHQSSGQVWLICDVPESQINKLKTGNTCTITFSSFPDEKFTGKIEGFGEVVDDQSRMIKMRISLQNKNGQLKAGMFATVSFGISEGKLLTVPNTSIVTVQGKDYVFVQKSETQFERRDVMSGQQINNRIIIFNGLNSGDHVVTKGTIELKGLSFGY